METWKQIAVTLTLFLSCGCGLLVASQTLVEQYTNCTYQEHMEHTCRKGQSLNDGRCSAWRPCCHCPRHTWMPYFNNCPQCIPHTDCASLGRELIRAGNRTHDNVCGDKLELTTNLNSIQDVTSVPPPSAITQQQGILSERLTSPPQNVPSTSSVHLSSSPSRDCHDPKDRVVTDSGQLVKLHAVTYTLSILLFASIAGCVVLLISWYRQRSFPAPATV